VKFVRQFGAVLLVVAAVTALGVVWEHSSAAGWITPSGSRTAAQVPGQGRVARGGGNAPLPGGHPPPGALPGPANANANAVQLNWSDIGNLTSTAEIVAAAMAGVIVLEIARRRVWRARRAARLASAAVKPPGR
jgi:hypothetical protein